MEEITILEYPAAFKKHRKEIFLLSDDAELFFFSNSVLVNVMFAAKAVQIAVMIGKMLDELNSLYRHQETMFRSSSKTVLM